MYLKPKLIAITLLLMLCSINNFAQNRTQVTGVVVDSVFKNPINKATIAAIESRDSALIAYTLTDDKGYFNLSNLPTGREFILLISEFSHQRFSKRILLKPGEKMELSSVSLPLRSLNQVTIIGTRTPISVRKDTIEFSAEAFKVRPNAVTEELLRKLPGVQINADGSIMYNGKSISKLLVDGKRFFSDDPKIATRNLDAELINQIQIYDDRENDPDHKLSEAQVNKIINLKLKKKYKKSTFGKIYGGSGTSKTFESGALINSFRDTLQVSLIGLTNNISRTAFSYDDLYNSGGFSRGGADGLSNGSIALGGNAFNSLQKVLTTGINLNTDYGKKLKINFNYFYSLTRDLYNTLQRQRTTLADTIVFGNSNNNRLNLDRQHNFNTLVQWNPDERTQFRYNASSNYKTINYTDIYENFLSNNRNGNTSLTQNNNFSDSKSYGFNHSVFYYKSFKNRNSLTITNGFSVNHNQKDQFINSLLTTSFSNLPTDSLHKLINSSGNSANFDLGLNYRMGLGEHFFLDWNYGGGFNSNRQRIGAYNRDEITGAYRFFIADESSLLHRKQLSNSLSSQITYKRKETTLITGLRLKRDDINDQFQIDYYAPTQHYNYLLPFFKIQQNNFSINYDAGVSFPSLTDLQPVAIRYNALYTFQGNSTLRPSYNHNLTLNYYHYDNKSQTSYGGYLSSSLQTKPVVTQKNINASGETFAFTSQLPNSEAVQSSASLYINRRLKTDPRWQVNLSGSINGSTYSNLFVINDNVGRQITSNIGSGVQGTLNYNNLIDLTTQLNAQASYTFYQNASFSRVRYFNPSTTNKLLVYLPKNFTCELIYAFTRNSQANADFQRQIHLLNSSVAWLFFKNKSGQIKLSAFDLLNNNVSVSRIAFENSIYDSENRIQKRYFLLTLLYKFKVSSKK